MSQIVKLTDLRERYAFADLASGKRIALKRVRARAAIVVVAPDWLGRIFVLYSWADRCAPELLNQKILDVAEAWRPTLFGIEGNAMQELFAGLTIRDAQQRGIDVPLTPVNQPTHVEKDWRIRTTLQPLLAKGLLLIPQTMMELRIELQSFPMSPTKDLVDALASACKLVPQRPTRIQQDEEREALAQYLRDSGTPPSDIVARLQAYDREHAA